jgi:UDP-glucose 4-epimerase
MAIRDVLITGGCGFIGSNLAQALAGKGARVRILDLNPEFPAATPKGLQLFTGDIRDLDLCRKAARGADAIVHLAAQAGIAQSLDNPIENAGINFGGTLNLLTAAKEEGARRFIFASSGAVLGEHAPPGHEEMPAKPISPYGAGKLSAEAYCGAFSGAFGLSTAALRFSNVYGPGSFHKGSVVALFCKRALKSEPFTIYGDGKQTRDFLYIYDLAEWIGRFLERPEASGVFHLASGKPTTIGALAEMIRTICFKETGRKPEVDNAPERPFEVKASYFSNAKAAKATGYVPETALDEGLLETWKWFTKNSQHLSPATELSE